MVFGPKQGQTDQNKNKQKLRPWLESRFRYRRSDGWRHSIDGYAYMTAKKGLPRRLGKPWTARTEDELWRRVLSQIVVVGRAEPGYRLQHDKTISRQLTIRKLKAFKSDVVLQKHLHRIFLSIGVRFAGNSWRSDRKALAGTRNFRIIQQAGGPSRFFGAIAKLKTEKKRITALQRSLKFYGDKGSRDTLIELRLATDCMALDVRIFRILERVGLKVSPADIFEQLERELIRKVAKPLGLSGAQLDRILFGQYSKIVKA
jgi:hypothetical protein